MDLFIVFMFVTGLAALVFGAETLVKHASALIAPDGIAIPETVLHTDLPILLLVTLGCLPLLFTHHNLNRWEGSLFLGYYSMYTLYLILEATQNPVAENIGTVFWFALLPLTIVVALITSVRYRWQIKTETALNKAA